jgi:hypothetical protein
MTTRRESSYLSFTPRRTSFDNLIVLANYEERLKDARKVVWRDRGEPAIDVHNLRQCLLHGARGGLRTSSFLVKSNFHFIFFFFSGAGIIAFNTRAGVNLVLLLARIKSLTKCAPYPVFPPTQP